MDKNKKKEIEKQAREILDKFGKALGKIKLKDGKIGSGLSGFRKEGTGDKENKDFRERMFANAPKKEGDFILAEKKKW